MNDQELRQAAIDCLAKAFKGGPDTATPQPHITAAAVTVLSMVPKAPANTSTAPDPTLSARGGRRAQK